MAFLAGDSSRHMTGQTLHVNGGRTYAVGKKRIFVTTSTFWVCPMTARIELN